MYLLISTELWSWFRESLLEGKCIENLFFLANFSWIFFDLFSIFWKLFDLFYIFWIFSAPELCVCDLFSVVMPDPLGLSDARYLLRRVTCLWLTGEIWLTIVCFWYSDFADILPWFNITICIFNCRLRSSMHYPACLLLPNWKNWTYFSINWKIRFAIIMLNRSDLLWTICCPWMPDSTIVTILVSFRLTCRHFETNINLPIWSWLNWHICVEFCFLKRINLYGLYVS